MKRPLAPRRGLREAAPAIAAAIVLAAPLAVGVGGCLTKPAAPPGRAPPPSALGTTRSSSAGASIDAVGSLDLARIPPEQRADARRVLAEAFAPCGCARSVAGCLAEVGTCPCPKASTLLFDLVARSYAQGLRTVEVERMLLEDVDEAWRKAPLDPAITAALEGLPSKGPADARHVIVEFADFRCGHCRYAFPVLRELVEARSDVRLVFAYFPLGAGTDTPSVLAAEACAEAHAQGRFWEMAELVFENQHSVDRASLLAYGERAGLDVAALDAALDDHRHKKRVLDAKNIGTRLDVTSTPTLFVDGRPFGLPRTRENLDLRLDLESGRGTCD